MEPKISTVTWRSVLYGSEFRAIRWLSVPSFIILNLNLLVLLLFFPNLIEYVSPEIAIFQAYVPVILLLLYFLLIPLIIIPDIIAIALTLTFSLRRYKGKAQLVAFTFVVFQLVFLCLAILDALAAFIYPSSITQNY